MQKRVTTCKNTSQSNFQRVPRQVVACSSRKGGMSKANNQNAPESGPKTAQSVPNPSQTEPQDFPKSDFPSLFGFICFWSQICMFSLQFCGRMCLFFKEPTFKIHAPTQCFVDFHTSGLVWKKYIKNRRKILPKPSQIRVNFEEKARQI